MADFADLEKGCEQLGLALAQTQLQALQGYIDLLRKWNKAINLISRKDMKRLVARHIMDSLAGHTFIQGNAVLDVGSGAGLPGIPLAIARPDVQFTLCDRMARRTRFLTQVVRELALPNVTVVNDDVRSLPASSTYQTIVARAVEPTQVLWQMLQQRIAPGGSLLVYSRTSEDSPDDDEQAAQGLAEQSLAQVVGGEVLQHRVNVPGMQSAHTITEIKKP